MNTVFQLLFSGLTNFKRIALIFEHLLTYCTPLVRDQSSFYEIRNLAIYINIEAFNGVNRKQLNILKTLTVSGILFCCLLKVIRP